VDRDALEGYVSPIAGAAGAVMLVTAWLPWVTKSLRIGGLVTVTRSTGFSSWQGKLSLVAGIALVAAAVIRRVEESDGWKRGACGMAAAAGLLAVVCAVHQIMAAHPADAAERALHVTFSLGAGLYLTLAAGVAGLAAGVIGIREKAGAVPLAILPPGGAAAIGITAAPLPPWERVPHPSEGPTGNAAS
jgi:hypothetical protein